MVSKRGPSSLLASPSGNSTSSAYAGDHACVQKRWTLRRAGTALAAKECVAPDGDFPTHTHLASADFAAGRMTRRSLGCYVPNRISAHWRSRVWLLGTTGLPVGLHHQFLFH